MFALITWIQCREYYFWSIFVAFPFRKHLTALVDGKISVLFKNKFKKLSCSKYVCLKQTSFYATVRIKYFIKIPKPVFLGFYNYLATRNGIIVSALLFLNTFKLGYWNVVLFFRHLYLAQFQLHFLCVCYYLLCWWWAKSESLVQNSNFIISYVNITLQIETLSQ